MKVKIEDRSPTGPSRFIEGEFLGLLVLEDDIVAVIRLPDGSGHGMFLRIFHPSDVYLQEERG